MGAVVQPECCECELVVDKPEDVIQSSLARLGCSTLRRVPKMHFPRLLGRDPGEEREGMMGSTVAAPKTKTRYVRCANGHEMRAKLAREMLQMWRCTEDQQCCLCERGLTDHDAYYRCKVCNVDYCLSCSRAQLGLSAAVPRGASGPALRVGPGDILLCGPDKYGIHHVVLVRGQLEAAPECDSVLAVPPGAELLRCETIESTQGSTGSATWWYPTTTIIQRDSHAGTALVVADQPPDSDTVYTFPEPVPCKVLLHPLRPEVLGAELDQDVFEEALEACALRSQEYSWNTAVHAFLAYQRSMHVEEYPTSEERIELLDQIRASWERPPICSAVAIKVWQQYFDSLHSDDPDDAAICILHYMPVWCDATTPSAMVKTLTYHGWSLYESLEA
mmetsp:Transcript_136767/g.346424  ORF Transcript_136767/g.346424 Transcript_136767/m.346424 type:complete len:390 (-) Transcript_136767:46-1215(-)